MVICPRCGAQNPDNVSLCSKCSNLLAAPNPAAPFPPQQPPQYSDPLNSLIPTKNPPALLSYYLGLFSIMPLLGLPMAIIALVQGRKGWKMATEFPQVSGKAHAGIGMGCGGVGLLVNLFLLSIAGLALLGSGHKP